MIYRALNAAFNKAVRWNYIEKNPLGNFTLPRIPKNHPLFVTQSDLEKVLEQTTDKDLRDIFLFAYYTGCRLGEILNLRWDSIDFKQNIIKITNSENFTTKSKLERIIPICDALNEMLRTRIPLVVNINHVNTLVFYKFNDVPYLSNYVGNNFKKAVRKVQVDPQLHFHCLRHGFASRLVQNGVSLYVVKELLGHQSISTTQIYSHLQKEQLTNAIKTFDVKAI